MNRALLIAALVIPGGLIMLAAWKGREIRAELTMMGEGWNRLHPTVQQKAMQVLQKARAAGLHVGIFEGYRSRERQAELMASGATKVTDPDSSYHRWGLAVDFVFINRLGGWTWEPEGGAATWEKLGAIIEGEGFEWGGRWKFYDGPHAQLPILRIAALKSAYINPENVTWQA